jgi:hypothetical protein
MNQQDSIALLLKKLNDGIDFAADELPDVAKQMIALEKATALYPFYVTVCTCGIGSLLLLGTYATAHLPTIDLLKFIGGVMVLVGGIFSIPALSFGIFRIKQITIAPKVFVLEELTNLMRKGGSK